MDGVGRSTANARLAHALGALASPVRLCLLRQLRKPKALGEIYVESAAGEHGEAQRPRPLARQTIKQHLEKLLDTGVVVAREVRRDYGQTVEYSLNHQSLFALSEEFRDLAAMRPVMELFQATLDDCHRGPGFGLARPGLVLVKGLDEGKAFEFKPGPHARSEWLLGRRRGMDVCLDFDPYVSTENAVVRLRDDIYTLHDLPYSRNGTTLNFVPLPRGGSAALESGDVVGLGRSLLMFRR